MGALNNLCNPWQPDGPQSHVIPFNLKHVRNGNKRFVTSKDFHELKDQVNQTSGMPESRGRNMLFHHK